MLTIKIISDGRELVKEIKYVEFIEARKSVTGSARLIYCEPENEYSLELSEGDIFVMNENGRTVANYCLGHPEVTDTGNRINMDDMNNSAHCKA